MAEKRLEPESRYARMEFCAECGGEIDPDVNAWTCYAGAYVCGPCEDDHEEDARENESD